MINWISSEDEKNARKVDFYNLYKIMSFIKSQKCNDEMVQYVCQIYDEYKDILCYEPLLLKESLQNYYGDNFVVDYNLENSDIIISPSDLNAYYTIKELNKDKKRFNYCMFLIYIVILMIIMTFCGKVIVFLN